MIVVYGATGDVGERVARQLAERAEVACAGRDRRRLERVAERVGAAEVRVAAAHDADALERIASDASVVVNCADPFRIVGPPVLAAAIAGRAHYVDIAGDQGWLRRSYEAWESRARRAGVICVAGLGLEAAIGDWAASLAKARLDSESDDADSDQPVDEIHIGHALSSSRRSLLEDLAGECAVWRVDRWERVAPGSRRRRFSFGDLGTHEAVLFPRGEAITVPRHLAARQVSTYLWLQSGNPLLWEATRAAPLVAPLVSLMSGTLRAIARSQPRRRRPEGDTDSNKDFVVVAEVSRGFSVGRVLIRGTDAAALSARLAANAAVSLAARESSGEGGMLAPSEAFDARTQLHLLESLGLIEVT